MSNSVPPHNAATLARPTSPCEYHELTFCCSLTDTGNTVGKRYARTDEIGVPYAITVDFDTLEGEGITLRERDSMTQVCVAIAAKHVCCWTVDHSLEAIMVWCLLACFTCSAGIHPGVVLSLVAFVRSAHRAILSLLIVNMTTTIGQRNYVR